MISIREIRNIVRNYPPNCQPTRIEPLGMVGGMSGAQFWRIVSPCGTLVLRQWPSEHPPADRLRFIHGVLFHAAERGIRFLPVPIRTTSGETFIRFAGSLWELATWMPGTADYEHSPTPEKLRAAMTALAHFHVAVQDFRFAATELIDGALPAPSRHLARLQQLSSSGANQLTRAVSNSIWPELAPLANRFLAELPRYLRRAVAQLKTFADISLPLQPCIRDIWHDHVLFTGNEVTGIVDFGAVGIDTPATDIARLLGSLVGDDPTAWRNGIEAYSTIRPLTAEEERLVKALDTGGTILAGCNWLSWIYVEDRQFDDRAQIMERFRRIVRRCSKLDVTGD